MWLVNENALQSYDREGARTHSVDLRTLGIRKPKLLAFDPISHSLWVGSEGKVSVFSDNGGYVTSWPAKNDEEALGVPRFAMLPPLSPIRPQAHGAGNRQNYPLSTTWNGDATIDLYTDQFFGTSQVGGTPVLSQRLAFTLPPDVCRP